MKDWVVGGSACSQMQIIWFLDKAVDRNGQFFQMMFFPLAIGLIIFETS